MENPTCPYCQKPLKKAPSRKSKCPLCQETIYVKGTPDNREKRLMTSEQAEAAEFAWDKYHRQQCDIRMVSNFGFTESDLARKSALELVAEVAATADDANTRKMAAHTLGTEAWRRGESGFVHFQQRAREELMSYLDEGIGIGHVRIVTAGRKNGACEVCLAQEGHILPIGKAMQTMPIPHPSCEGEFCRCYYEHVFDDELPGHSKPARRKSPPPAKAKFSTVTLLLWIGLLWFVLHVLVQR